MKLEHHKGWKQNRTHEIVENLPTNETSCLLIGFALDIDAFAYIGMCCSEVFCQQTMFWKRLSVGFSWVWGESIWLPRTTHWELSLDIILSYFTEVAFRAFCIWSLQLFCDETFLSWWGWSLAERPSLPSIWFNEFENDEKTYAVVFTVNLPLSACRNFFPPFNLPLVYMFKIAVYTYYF